MPRKDCPTRGKWFLCCGNQRPNILFSYSFANCSDCGLDTDISISNWLFERRAFTIGRIVLNGNNPEEEEINGMIKCYDRLTDFCWPANWQELVRPFMS
jgi:hypothetical protein